MYVDSWNQISVFCNRSWPCRFILSTLLSANCIFWKFSHNASLPVGKGQGSFIMTLILTLNDLYSERRNSKRLIRPRHLGLDYSDRLCSLHFGASLFFLQKVLMFNIQIIPEYKETEQNCSISHWTFSFSLFLKGNWTRKQTGSLVWGTKSLLFILYPSHLTFFRLFYL